MHRERFISLPKHNFSNTCAWQLQSVAQVESRFRYPPSFITSLFLVVPQNDTGIKVLITARAYRMI